MAQQVRTRQQGTLTFSGAQAFGQRQTLDLGRGNLYRELYLRFVGSFTYAAGANNSATTLGRGDEWSVIQRIEIITDSGVTLRSFSGTELFWWNKLIYGHAGTRSSAMGNGTNANPDFDSTLRIPFWMHPPAHTRMDTALDTSRLSSLRLEVTFGPNTNVNASAPPTSVAAAIEVSSYESWGLVNPRLSTMEISSLTYNVPGANAAFEVNLEVQPMYRGFLLNFADGASPTANDQNAVCNQFSIVSGTNVIFNQRWAALRDLGHQIVAHEAPRIVAFGSSVIAGNELAQTMSTRSNYGAWAYVDLAPDGYVYESLDTLGFSECKLRFDVTGATTITVIPTKLYPVRDPR